MKSRCLVAIVVGALAAGAGLTAYPVRNPKYCPEPKATSITMLFAPCQSFDAVTQDGAIKRETLPINWPPRTPRRLSLNMR